MKSNEKTFISLFYACSGLTFSQLAKMLHAHLILNGLDDNAYDGRLLKSLIYIYSEFGILDATRYLFSYMGCS